MMIRVLAVLAVLAGVALPAAEAFGQTPMAGRPLSDVLRELQRRGLRIVFSSELVRRDMRVEREPAGGDDRRRLDEILEPHGLEVQVAARGVLLVARRRPTPRTETVSTAAGRIRGLIVETRSASPVPAALIRVPGTDLETLSDADGRFELAGVPVGMHRLYISVVGYALAEPEVSISGPTPLDLTIALSDGASTYTEEIDVVGDRFRGNATAVPSAFVLNSADLRELRGVLTDDAFRAVQALPSVMSASDLRSEFSIRGSDFRHVGLSIDGVASTWPVHSVRGDLGGGSVGLINADVVDNITLLAGAYPQDQPARSGGWLDVALREGSRARAQVHGSLSMTAASLVTEGPIGSGEKGSWLVSARQSYLQWLVKRWGADGTVFGYGDVLGKLVLDVTPRQQVQFVAMAGRSLLEIRRVDPDPNLVTRGSAASSLFASTWRTTFGPRAALVQKVGLATDTFTNDGPTIAAISDGSGHELSYRAEGIVAPAETTTLRVGLQAHRQSVDQVSTRFIGFAGEPRDLRTETLRGDRSVVAVHARASTTIRSRLFVDGGALAGSGVSGAVSPWILVSLPVEHWTLRAGSGIYRQLPGLDQVGSSFGGEQLAPEYSRHIDVSLDRGWGGHTRAHIGIYRRDERDVLRLEDDEFRIEGDELARPSLTPSWRNALRARATGIELLVQRRAPTGVSGWISYGYSTTRYEDSVTGERFDGDFDQRHSLGAFGQYRVRPDIAVSGKLRVGSNFPIPGYLESRSGELVVAAERNRVRLPLYARLDLRANRAFNMDSRRLTLFAEIVNVFGRSNTAAACACAGWADSPRVLRDGRVISATQRLFPFLPTVGIVFDF